MSEHIWLSDGNRGKRAEENFFPDYELSRTPEQIKSGRDPFEKVTISAKLHNRMNLGEPVPAEDLPRRFYHSSTNTFDQEMPLVFGTPFLLFKDAAVDLMSQFDLGNAYFKQVNLYQWDRVTPIDLKVSIICIGNAKSTVLQDESPHIDEGPNGMKELRILAEDDSVVTTKTALNGPDLWWDPEIFNRFFLSDRLAQALIRAGLKEDFALVRTKTI